MGEPRTFPVDLWDGVNIVYNRFEEGRRTLTDMIEFYTKRQALEEHYAKDLQKLCSRPSQTSEGKTFGTAWSQSKADSETHMRLRYEFSNKLSKDILTELNNLKTEQTKQKNTLTNTITQLQADLDKKGKALLKAKQTFHQKSEVAESALSTFEKAQQDPSYPPKSLSKLNAQQQKLRKEAEAADQQYQAIVQDHQAFQVVYEQKMKESLAEFQQMEERRLQQLQVCLDRFHKFQDELVKETLKSQEVLAEAISKINGMQDLQQFIVENRTDKVPIPPVEYVPYKQQYSHPNPTRPNPPSNGKQPMSVPSTPPHAVSGPSSKSASTSVKRAKALYDYAAADETELGFDVNQIVIITKIDDSGWWEGTCNGRSGMFPGNYVELIEEGAAPPSGGGGGGGGSAAAAAAPAPAPAPAAGIRKCRVTYDFTAENGDELTIREGEVVVIDSENEGWFMGTNSRGQSGLFPANYVTEL